MNSRQELMKKARAERIAKRETMSVEERQAVALETIADTLEDFWQSGIFNQGR